MPYTILVECAIPGAHNEGLLNILIANKIITSADKQIISLFYFINPKLNCFPKLVSIIIFSTIKVGDQLQ